MSYEEATRKVKRLIYQTILIGVFK
ncbi:uncharacterized protein METZ01_LOCUS439126, partial [marine metagenome]